MDTLDYSGSGFNEGSKVVVAAAGDPIRELPTELPSDLRLPGEFRNAKLCFPGIVAIEGPNLSSDGDAKRTLRQFCESTPLENSLNKLPLIILVDDSSFSSRTLNNFLWTTFTRSNPASDIDGIAAFTDDKHWGCQGSLVIDARIKPHHAPPLIECPEITKRVDAMAARGGTLAKYL